MARQCTICGKRAQRTWRLVKLRGKYNPTIKRRQYPNLQWVSVPKNTKKPEFKKFAGKRVLACTKCIKTLSKEK